MKYFGPRGRDFSYLTPYPVPPGGVEAARQAAKDDSLEAQSGEELQTDDNTPTVSDAANEAASAGSVGGFETESVMSVVAGEMITSFRPLLKRYCLARRLVNNVIITGVVSRFSAPFTSFFPVASPSNNFTAPLTIQAYVSIAFASFRGATRHKFIPKVHPVPGQSTATTSPLVQRISSAPVTWPSPSVTTTPFSPLDIQEAAWLNDHSFSGSAISNEASGNVLTVELPYYDLARFKSIRNWSSTAEIDGVSAEFVLESFNPGGSLRFMSVHDHYVSVGEDFNLFFFLGVPPMWDFGF